MHCCQREWSLQSDDKFQDQNQKLAALSEVSSASASKTELLQVQPNYTQAKSFRCAPESLNGCSSVRRARLMCFRWANQVLSASQTISANSETATGSNVPKSRPHDGAKLYRHLVPLCKLCLRKLCHSVMCLVANKTCAPTLQRLASCSRAIPAHHWGTERTHACADVLASLPALASIAAVTLL